MQKRENIYILGCGRSGTSMTGGLFRNSGYFQGEHLHAPSQENPLGYFEDALVNGLNNRILARYLPKSFEHDRIEYGRDSPGDTNGWLSRISIETRLASHPSEKREISRLVDRQPFCFKDPRFSYTLRIWKEVADGICICVFRNPAVVVESILRCCRTRPGLFDVALSVNQAFEVWTLMYQHILRNHASTGRWLYCSYESLVEGRCMDRLERFVGHAVDRGFARRELDRTESDLELPDATARVYSALLKLEAS